MELDILINAAIEISLTVGCHFKYLHLDPTVGAAFKSQTK
jgi:hypothetical protein